MMKAADEIALFLKKRNIETVFGIVGAGNASIFDAINRLGYTKIICVHHEQAAAMAAQTYYRVSGKISVVLVTTGGGTTNVVTGVVGAWMDSIPVLIIAGNENSKFTKEDNNLRIWGVQGFDSVNMLKGVTKYSKRIISPNEVLPEIEKAYKISEINRPGPCFLEIPMNIQSAPVSSTEGVHLATKNLDKPKPVEIDKKIIFNEEQGADLVFKSLLNSKRPLIWLGHGVRLSNAIDLVKKLIEKLNCPTLVSWTGIDILNSDHPLVFGRAGVYGQRAANFILQNCDFLLTIGTRLSIPQVGYDINEFARDAKIATIDIDTNELSKHIERINYPICCDAKKIIKNLLSKANNSENIENTEWVKICNNYRKKYPVIEQSHSDKNGYINSYRFIEKLNKHLSHNEIIVTDMGTALLCAHQVLKLNGTQRLITSQGLGEMGFGLPAAIGASFGSNKGPVLCLNCDGGMMMNLQELQTIVHHQLPIKIIVFSNDGYLMIKHTQKALFKNRMTGTNKETGVSCPNYTAIAKAFNINSFIIKTWQDFDKVIPEFQLSKGPVICEVFMDPMQLFLPKLSIIPQADGSIISPPLEDLSPLVSKSELLSNMLIQPHVKSLRIRNETEDSKLVSP
ncbi:MAG: Acetolactate synthase large subunit [Chlamydiae bacterium]|nr:Acetolactate synthase large subunit [Chlamydiota bacterium]